MDIKTILLCLFVINFFLGFYTYIIKKTQPTFAGIDFWISSNIFISLGYLLMSQRAVLPVYLSVIGAQILFLSAGFLRIYGLKRFFNKPQNTYLIYVSVVCILLYAILLYHFAYVDKSEYVRTIFSGLVLSGISLFTGVLVLQNRVTKGKYAYFFTAFTFFAFSAIFIFRILAWVFIPSIRGLFAAFFVNELQFISSMLIDISWTTMFFVIHNQRLTYRLQESEEKFRAIFKQNSSALALIDYDTTITMTNDAYCTITGYSSGELIGKSWMILIPEEDLARLKKYNQERIQNSGMPPTDYEFKFCTKQGEIRHGLMSVALLPSMHKIVASFIDITERKNSEIKLQEYATELDHLNKGKDRFLSILAHDLKGPFGSMVNLSGLLAENFSKFRPEDVERQLNMIYQTTRRTYNLFEDLLLWSASNLGKLPFEPVRIEFGGLCEDVLESLRFKADAKKIKLSNTSVSNVNVTADVNMLKAVLRNLIANALKFTPEHGSVEVSAEIQDHRVVISVADTGVGISAENQKKIWDISTNYTTAGTANEKGTGLGLLLCKEFVEKHGGEIWVESEPGKGSCFRFTMPA